MAAPHVVILGGGFGGLTAAKALRRAPVHVTLIDRRNHHLFQPLLYEVATAALSPADIAAPLRSVLSRQRNVTVLLGEATLIDAHHKRVVLADGMVEYDMLIVATGSTHSYFGKPEWAAVAPGLKTVEDALEIRRRFLLAFEAAEREGDEAARRAKLTFVVVGGGPTGVELAGTMAEIARRGIPRDFRHVDTTTARVILVEAEPRVLMAMPESLSLRAKRDLEALGVEVRTGSRVTHIDGGGVMIGNERIAAENVMWAAGVAASGLGKSLGAPVDRQGRVLVNPDCSVPGHPNVFVVGDLATLIDPRSKQPVPGVAQGAMQMGAYVARIIADEAARGSRSPLRDKPFTYRNKGSMATIGRARAVAHIGKLKFGGALAWLLWAFIHILFLIGFRRRIVVMLGWAWAYIVFRRGARLITGSTNLELQKSWSDSP